MKIARVLAIAAVAALLSVNASTATAYAKLDTSWGYVTGGGR
ncbi:hypothetical protein [Nocardioides jishulii]|nr:hypothetical protein [Nocardioides jishulii]